MAGLIRYLLGPGRANEHTTPHVVATSQVLSVPHDRELTDVERLDLADQLDWPTRMHETRVQGGHVWHLSLTADPSDRDITDPEWAEMVERIMEGIGVSDPSKSAARWVAINHGRNETGSQHVHVALNLVRDNGSVVSTWQDLPKLSQAMRDIEQHYGLTVVAARWKGTGTPGLERAEIERARRQGRPEPDRATLERVVRSASVIAQDESEFVRRVARDGVLIRPRLSEDGRKVIGYAVALTENQSAPVWFSGGNLKKDLTLPALRRHWTGAVGEVDAMATWATHGQPRVLESASSGAIATVPRSATVATLASSPVIIHESPEVQKVHKNTGGLRRHYGGAGPPLVGDSEVEATPTPSQGKDRSDDVVEREDLRIAAGEWDAAQGQVAQIVDALAGVDPHDEATWALAARETAGVLAAWSRRIEPTPGPLARAAQEVGRSAQVPPGAPLERPDVSPLRNLRGVAMVMAQASMRSDSAAAWALLATQLVELVSQIEAAHRARDEAHRAGRLATQAQAELEKVREDLRRVDDLRQAVPASVASQITEPQAREESATGQRVTKKRPGATPQEQTWQRRQEEQNEEHRDR